MAKNAHLKNSGAELKACLAVYYLLDEGVSKRKRKTRQVWHGCRGCLAGLWACPIRCPVGMHMPVACVGQYTCQADCRQVG